jgi:DNA-directed RNA polymerase subunit RPC12/RpoP
MPKDLATAVLPDSEVPLQEKEASACALGDSPKTPGGDLLWKYDCHECKITFEKPPPRGPKEERETRCPGCGSMDIERLNTGGLAETPCGG